MLMDVNYSCCGDHFVIYINIESLCYIPETNNVVCQLKIIKELILLIVTIKCILNVLQVSFGNFLIVFKD